MPAHQAPPVPNRVSPERVVAHRVGRMGRALLCAAALALGSGLAHADNDHDRARQALQAGEVLPLATILERVEREHPGRVLDVDLEREKVDRRDRGDPGEGVRRWVYEIKLLTPGGTRLKLLIDARSGDLIATRRRD